MRPPLCPQLFIGTLLFTILLFLLPTTALYYLVFTLVSRHGGLWVAAAVDSPSPPTGPLGPMPLLVGGLLAAASSRPGEAVSTFRS